MRGPAPKPTALKLIEGNRGKRATNQQEPDPDYLDDLTPPAHLQTHVAAVWDELAPRLRSARLLTVADTVALELACGAIADYRLASAQGGTRCIMKNEETGSLSLSPWLLMKSMAFKQAVGMLAKFGMTPADRTRVMSNPQGNLPLDPADSYFN